MEIGAGESKKILILDRDGVINRDSDNYIRRVEEFIPLPGSPEAIIRFQRAGYLVAIATNQSGIARGYFDKTELEAMHRKLDEILYGVGAVRGIDYVAYCPHGPEDACECRKPRPGLILEIFRELDVGPGEAVLVGDSARDLEAARGAGVRPILVRTGKGERTLAKGEGITGVTVFADLAGVANTLLD